MPTPPGPLPQRPPTSTHRAQQPAGASGEKAPEAPQAAPARGGTPAPGPLPSPSRAPAPAPAAGQPFRPQEHTQVSFKVPSFESHVSRSRTYAFLLDDRGAPIELGSGRFAKAYRGEEKWVESKTAFSREVAIKMLQKGVSEEDALRFQMEKELLERVQGHPNIIHLYASGESDNPAFIPPSIRDKVENDFMIVELMEMSLEERLKGARNRTQREDLLSYGFRERLFRVLEYMLPVAAAVEYAHIVRNVCHRDIKPANVLLRLPDSRLQGATMDVRLADFNVGKVKEDTQDLSMTRFQQVPGTLFFQAPEQETNVLELLVNVENGSADVEYFEDFYMPISRNDVFQLYNRNDRYMVMGADRARMKLVLAQPWAQRSERNVRAKIIKSVDRPADIYSLGAMFYYLVSGAYANPKSLYESFHKFIEYSRQDEQNIVEAYIEHEYQVINNLRAPKKDQEKPEVAPADRFFTYKQYLDGNGELIDKQVMLVIARAMIRNKPDSYCQAWDVNTTGISDLVADLVQLYGLYGVDASARPAYLGRFSHATDRRRSARGGPLARLVDFFRTGEPRQPRPPKEPRRKPPPPPPPPKIQTGRHQAVPPRPPGKDPK
jgi:serine/threonine protein kinase